MKNKKNINDKSQKASNFILFLLDGFIQKFSLKLILNAKKQIEDLLFKIKKGLLIGFFTLTGLFFLFIGLIIYLGSVLNFFPGSGFFIVGGVSFLVAVLLILIKK